LVAPARIAGSCADWTRAIARIVATAALAGDGGSDDDESPGGVPLA
jgi:hypothetical protein